MLLKPLGVLLMAQVLCSWLPCPALPCLALPFGLFLFSVSSPFPLPLICTFCFAPFLEHTCLIQMLPLVECH